MKINRSLIINDLSFRLGFAVLGLTTWRPRHLKSIRGKRSRKPTRSSEFCHEHSIYRFAFSMLDIFRIFSILSFFLKESNHALIRSKTLQRVLKFSTQAFEQVHSEHGSAATGNRRLTRPRILVRKKLRLHHSSRKEAKDTRVYTQTHQPRRRKPLPLGLSRPGADS